VLTRPFQPNLSNKRLDGGAVRLGLSMSILKVNSTCLPKHLEKNKNVSQLAIVRSCTSAECEQTSYRVFQGK
jgi:hypothetical protein